MLNRMKDTRARVVAQLDTGNYIGLHNTLFLQWECDHIFAQLSYCTSLFLDMTMQQHSSVLSTFTLDVAQLSRAGLNAIQNVLGRSNLELLHVMCLSSNPQLSECRGQVLGSLRWYTHKSLKLSGEKIDMWVQYWPSIVTPQLLCLEILPHDLEAQDSPI